MSKKKTTEEFIADSIKAHGTRYEYSKVDYKNNRTKVCIICKEHGVFWQRPSEHIGGQGCPYCSGNAKLSTEAFIKKSKAIHGDLYDYSKVKYVNSHTDVTIGCSQHGWFNQSPNNHLQGKMCGKCSGNVKYTTSDFIEKATKVHNGFYSYEKVDYKGAHTDVVITCPKHGEFKQTPTNHLRNKGCPVCGQLKCATSYYNIPTILYFIKFTRNNQKFLKIGITTKTVKERFAREHLSIQTLHTIQFETGKPAFTCEQYLLNKYKQHKTKEEPLYGGNSEVLTHSKELEQEIKSILKDIHVRDEKN